MMCSISGSSGWGVEVVEVVGSKWDVVMVIVVVVVVIVVSKGRSLFKEGVEVVCRVVEVRMMFDCRDIEFEYLLVVSSSSSNSGSGGNNSNGGNNSSGGSNSSDSVGSSSNNSG
jgi:uncharacterized membrane protein YgcG